MKTIPTICLEAQDIFTVSAAAEVTSPLLLLLHWHTNTHTHTHTHTHKHTHTHTHTHLLLAHICAHTAVQSSLCTWLLSCEWKHTACIFPCKSRLYICSANNANAHSWLESFQLFELWNSLTVLCSQTFTQSWQQYASLWGVCRDSTLRKNKEKTLHCLESIKTPPVVQAEPAALGELTSEPLELLYASQSVWLLVCLLPRSLSAPLVCLTGCLQYYPRMYKDKEPAHKGSSLPLLYFHTHWGKYSTHASIYIRQAASIHIGLLFETGGVWSLWNKG